MRDEGDTRQGASRRFARCVHLEEVLGPRDPLARESVLLKLGRGGKAGLVPKLKVAEERGLPAEVRQGVTGDDPVTEQERGHGRGERRDAGRPLAARSPPAR